MYVEFLAFIILDERFNFQSKSCGKEISFRSFAI